MFAVLRGSSGGSVAKEKFGAKKRSRERERRNGKGEGNGR